MGAFLIALGLVAQANLVYEHYETEHETKLWEEFTPTHEYIVDSLPQGS